MIRWNLYCKKKRYSSDLIQFLLYECQTSFFFVPKKVSIDIVILKMSTNIFPEPGKMFRQFCVKSMHVFMNGNCELLLVCEICEIYKCLSFS